MDDRYPSINSSAAAAQQQQQQQQDLDSTSDTSIPSISATSNNNDDSPHTTTHVVNKTKKKSKGRAFQCTAYPPCSMSFTRSEHLARHIRSHTGEKPFKCQHCQKNFSRLDNLRQHRQTVHAYENFILTYPNEKLMIRVRNDEFNEIKKNLGIDESNMVRVSYQEDEVDVAKQLSDLRNLPSPNPITPINSQYNFHQQQQQQQQQHHHHQHSSSTSSIGNKPRQISILSPPNSTSPHNHNNNNNNTNSSTPTSDTLPPPRPSASSSLLRPLQFRPDNNKRPRPILVPESDDEGSQQSSAYLSTPLSGRSLVSPLSPYYNSQLHHMNYINNQLHPPSTTTPSTSQHVLSPYQQNFSQDIKDHKKLPAIKFRDSQQSGKQSPIVDENRYKMKVSNLMNDNNNNNNNKGDNNNSNNSNGNHNNNNYNNNSNNNNGQHNSNNNNHNGIGAQKNENGTFRLPSFKELDFK